MPLYISVGMQFICRSEKVQKIQFPSLEWHFHDGIEANMNKKTPVMVCRSCNIKGSALFSINGLQFVVRQNHVDLEATAETCR